ncbi:hypothetical protein FOFC_13184 [Fusarium oxysporum]|nr:hypothetical protein FOFC_13184 [Fusarium oxysporum]
MLSPEDHSSNELPAVGGAGMCLPQELGLDFEQLLVEGISLPPALRLHMEVGQVVGNPPDSRVVEAQGLVRRLKGQGKEASAQEAVDGQEIMTLQHGSDGTDALVPKRRRLHNCEVQGDIMDSYITISNCKVFLAYVNYELQNLL